MPGILNDKIIWLSAATAHKITVLIMLDIRNTFTTLSLGAETVFICVVAVFFDTQMNNANNKYLHIYS